MLAVKEAVMSGTCSLCKTPLNVKDGRVIQAGTQLLHEKCFFCVQCFQPFPNGVYFLHNDRLYCEHDYKQLYGMRCSMCTDHIVGRCVTALNKQWHPEHFACEICDLNLVGVDYVKNSERPICRPCHKELNKREIRKPKCELCGEDLGNTFLLVKGQRIHPEHHECNMCKCVLDHLAREKYNHWYCFYCYDKVSTLPTCGMCKEVIEGRSVNALGKAYHPEHFVCVSCGTVFAGDSYYEYKGQPYCFQDYRAIHDCSCFICQEIVEGKLAFKNTLYKEWCSHHFRCFGCDKGFEDNPKFIDWDGKPMCTGCWKTLPRKTRKSLLRKD